MLIARPGRVPAWQHCIAGDVFYSGFLDQLLSGIVSSKCRSGSTPARDAMMPYGHGRGFGHGHCFS